MSTDTELQMLQMYVTRGLPQNKDDLEPTLDKYWPIWHDLAIINGVAMKGKQIITPFSLQKQMLDQLHSNHMGIEKMQLFVRKSVYWINMNADMKHMVRQCPICLKYQ